MIWRAEDPQGNEAEKIKYEVVPYTRGTVLDLGAGPIKTYPHWLTVDSGIDKELFGIDIKPMLTADCSDLSNTIQDVCVDAIFSSHLLEHIVDYRAALRDWWRCIKPGGYLVLYLPHKDFYPNIGEPGANPDHKHDFLPIDILEAMARFAHGFDLVVNETRREDCEYSFLQVYQKNLDEDHTFKHTYNKRRPEKTACVVRYGGFGDMLQAANILPELKRQGYHVTVMTTPKGKNVLEHDPHIDAWFIQDPDQVPNHELHAFWRVWQKHFTKFINLSESVEGTLLAMPGKTNHAWPQSMRDKHLNHNYLEFTAEIAELPYHSEAHFYATTEERRLAQALIQKAIPTGYRFNVLWALSGSSIHKCYPHQDPVIQNLLTELRDVHLFLVGDDACRILEVGWEKHPRVVCLSGELDIRETLTLAQAVDCVVGPETGVLNAVAFEPMAKVVLLSHSSQHNLTKHWLNTITLEPQNTHCYPCHRLHYGREHCWEHEPSGTAMCQFNITPDRVFEAIAENYLAWHDTGVEVA